MKTFSDSRLTMISKIFWQFS